MTPTVLITGGSSGIGFELAKLFAKDSYNLFLVSKPPQELAQAVAYFKEHFPETKIYTLAQDLSIQGSAAKVYEFTQTQALSIEVLINNAGVGTYGFLDSIDIAKEISMLNLNVLTLYHLTRLFLADMLAKNHGQIINIASVAAFQPNATLATYGASKSFVYSFSRALSQELKESGSAVKLLTVCPPATRKTAFQKRAGMEKTNTFEGFGTLDVEVVAEDAYKAFKNGKEFIIPGRGLRLLSMFVNRLPTQWRMFLARQHLQQK